MNYIIFCLQALSLGIRYVDTAPWQRGKNISPRDVGCHHDLIEMVRRIHVGSQNLIAHSSNLGNSLISRLCADVGDDLIVVDFFRSQRCQRSKFNGCSSATPGNVLAFYVRRFLRYGAGLSEQRLGKALATAQRNLDFFREVSTVSNNFFRVYNFDVCCHIASLGNLQRTKKMGKTFKNTIQFWSSCETWAKFNLARSEVEFGWSCKPKAELEVRRRWHSIQKLRQSKTRETIR